MTQKPIVVETTHELELEGPESGLVQIISPSSAKTKILGKGAFFGSTTVLLNGCVKGKCEQKTPFAGALIPSSTKAKEYGLQALREGDQSVVLSVPGTNSETSAACTIPTIVSVSNAGQNKVRTE